MIADGAANLPRVDRLHVDTPNYSRSDASQLPNRTAWGLVLAQPHLISTTPSSRTALILREKPAFDAMPVTGYVYLSLPYIVRLNLQLLILLQSILHLRTHQSPRASNPHRSALQTPSTLPPSPLDPRAQAAARESTPGTRDSDFTYYTAADPASPPTQVYAMA